MGENGGFGMLHLVGFNTDVKTPLHPLPIPPTSAQYNLGVMYRKGHGVPQDKVYAHIWYNIAATSGNKKAIKNRDILAEEMTPAQIEKAQDLARECIRKKYKGC